VLKPSRSLRAPTRRGLQWRLISHLALNHLSIVDGGAEALREILRLYNFSDNPAITSQIEGLQKISSCPETARIFSEHGLVFTRGLHTTVEFDEERYDNGGLFLFGSVLEKFLALYSSMNSFSKLSVVSRQRQGVVKIWPPRAGEQILL
jgi:type VI secretion system protein ImpG